MHLWSFSVIFFFLALCQNHFFTERTGEISSPDYPAPYPPLSTCSYNIQVEDGFLITLEFVETFDVETHPEVLCPYDVLQVRWGSHSLCETGPALLLCLPQSVFCSVHFKFCLSVSLLIHFSSHPFSFVVLFSQHLSPLGNSPKTQMQAHMSVMTSKILDHHNFCPHHRPVMAGNSVKSFPSSLLIYKTGPMITSQEFCSI